MDLFSFFLSGVGTGTKVSLTRNTIITIFTIMPIGVVVPDKVREGLNKMRMENRLSFQEISRLAKVSTELVRRVIRKGGTVRDTHAQALADLVAKYERGEITFVGGKAVAAEKIGA